MTTQPAQATEYPYLLPQPSELTQPYWNSLKKHELSLQHCTRCNLFQHPPQRTCRRCLGEDSFEWKRVSGRGSIYTYVIVTQGVLRQWRDKGPYNIVQVLPDEVDPATVSVHNNNTFNVVYGNLVEADDSALRVGLPVEAVFDDATPEVTILRWRPR